MSLLVLKDFLGGFLPKSWFYTLRSNKGERAHSSYNMVALIGTKYLSPMWLSSWCCLLNNISLRYYSNEVFSKECKLMVFPMTTSATVTITLFVCW